MDSDDHELPVLPRNSTPPPFFTASSRKKSRGYASSSSSDAPFFSSDDLADASVTNYDSPRRKRQQKRAWWEADDAQSKQPTRDSKRAAITKPKDSGVFMSSDSSADDGFSVEPLSLAKPKRRAKNESPFLRSPRAQSISPQELAERTIFECCDKGRPIIDLSQLGLRTISAATLRPLRDLILQPKTFGSPDSDDAYQSFTPSLQLFLSANSLQHVPHEIVNLENLTVLSLRNNNVTELPHSFGRLRNLVELNVSSNSLRWLPWDLLQLAGPEGKLKNLHIHPNPFIKPFSSLPDGSNPSSPGSSLSEMCDALGKEHVTNHEHKQLRSWVAKIGREQQATYESTEVQQSLTPRRRRLPCSASPLYLASTAKVYFEVDGRSSRFSQPSITTLSRDTQIKALVLAPCSSSSTSPSPGAEATMCEPKSCQSRVASLFELSLRSCAAAFTLSSMSKIFDSDADLPPSVGNALQMLENATTEGGWTCSVCSHSFVVPRAEWIEYWHCGSGTVGFYSLDELAVPFLRRACSWGCALSVNIR